METSTITAFLAMGTIIFIGFFGNSIFNKFRIPEVLILVTLGVVIGPDVLGERFDLVSGSVLADIDQFQDLFLSAALVVILFDGGLSLNLRTVIESMRTAVLMAVMNFVLVMLSVAVVLHLFMDIDFLVAAVLGSIVGGTTGAVVIPIARKMRIKERTKAMLIMESVMTDVLVIVSTLSILSIIQLGEVDLVLVTKELMVKFIVGGVAGFLAGIAWLYVLDRLQNQPLSYMITIAALFLVAAVVEMSPISSSGAVAALTFGLAMGNRRFVKKRLTSLSLSILSEDHIHQFHSEITFFVRTFFFVYLGLSFRFGSFTATHLVVGLLVISLAVLARRVSTYVTAAVGDLGVQEEKAVFALMPRGLAAAVLATLPAVKLAGLEVWSSDLGDLFLNTTFTVILGTTLLATIFSFLSERDIDRKNRMDLRKSLMEEDEDLRPTYR